MSNLNDRERLIELGAEIKRKRQEIQALEAEFDRLYRPVPASQALPPPVMARTPEAPSGPPCGSSDEEDDGTETAAETEPSVSLPQRILLRVQAQPNRLFSAEDFDDLRGDSSVPTLRSALLRLAERGLLSRPERGRFRMGMKPLFPSNGTAQ